MFPRNLKFPTSGSLYVRTAAATGVLTLASWRFAKGPAQAGQKRKYTARVKEILAHVQDHPLDLTSKPMIYEPDPKTPLPEVCQGLEPEHVMPRAGANEHWARVVTALLYLACGGLDHAHNLVTPLCWGASTPYSGKPIAGSPAAKEAAYVHALVHRAEGACDGEFGTGYSNASYWYGATGKHELYEPLLREAQQSAHGDPQLLHILANHGDSFDPHKFLTVCAQAAARRDMQLLPFCEEVVNREWRLLLDYCYDRM